MKKIISLVLFLLSFNVFASFTVSSQATGSISGTSTQILGPNAVRTYLLI